MVDDRTDSLWITPDWPAPANIRACITTRVGGVSLPPYASNNLGDHVGDNPEHVALNRMQLCRRLGLVRSPQWLTQIHGVNLVQAKGDGLVRTADGSYSNQPGQSCLVMTADCLPILLCDRAGTQVAALHGGWRSLAKGICARAIPKFKAAPEQILAYLGPAISQAHFEVGIDVLEAFFKAVRSHDHRDQIAAAFIPGERPMHFYADIYALARAELLSLGVTEIYGGHYCTYADSERFYSYRRDKTTGRMASLIWLE
ncbi:peptidoglycan editing factor PgeF [Cellvibrio japonicus]|nr:peptidoglycan editing factor PgeF [Cellvibrio japonicus]QEI17853.1 peptidoglycan editing factor PgeF [Cellvibrio japonicus]QEI21428.1 peptidoglycan editing factor PgeF [Cellvibrio japonicus]